MRQSRHPHWAVSACLLCLTAASLSAAQHVGQAAVHARTPYKAAASISLRSFSKRFLLDNSTFSTAVTTAPQSAASTPASKPIILQAADVTFRLVGTAAQPFSNASAQAFQKALHIVFSNFSSAAFVYQSTKVMTLALHCAPCTTAIQCTTPIDLQRQNTTTERLAVMPVCLNLLVVTCDKICNLDFCGITSDLYSVQMSAWADRSST